MCCQRVDLVLSQFDSHGCPEERGSGDLNCVFRSPASPGCSFERQHAVIRDDGFKVQGCEQTALLLSE